MLTSSFIQLSIYIQYVNTRVIHSKYNFKFNLLIDILIHYILEQREYFSFLSLFILFCSHSVYRVFVIIIKNL